MYTKVADMSADLVGKIEEHIEETTEIPQQ